MAVYIYEDIAGSVYLQAQGGYIQNMAWDMTGVVDNHTGIHDMLAADRGDIENWTLPQVADFEPEDDQEEVASLVNGKLILLTKDMGPAAQTYFGIKAVVET